QAVERLGKTVQNRRIIERRKIQFRRSRANHIYPRDELVYVMVEQREFKIIFPIRLGQTASRRRRINLTLMFVMDDQVLKPHQLNRGDPFVRAVEQMLDLRGEMLREHFFDPFTLYSAG